MKLIRVINSIFPTFRKHPELVAARVVTFFAALTIAAFLFFQHVLGYPPCPLCLDQRIAFYVSLPLAVLLWYGSLRSAPRMVLAIGFFAIAVVMFWNTGLSAYHAGIEWKLWPGPNDCSGPINGLGSAVSMLKRLQDIHIVRCDEAAWRFLGLSLAGYDALISLFLSAVAAGATNALFVRRDASE